MEILDLSLYPKKFWRKKAYTPGNSANLFDTPWKFLSQKPRPIEIPHQFFLNTPGISTSFLIDPWNFHVFSSRPPEIPCSYPPVWIFSGIAQSPLLLCKVHHFADDTNLLFLTNSIKKLNKLINIDLKNLSNWLNANKIYLNVKKTETILSKSRRKKYEGVNKLKLNRQRLHSSNNVKYLRIRIDENLNWKITLMTYQPN